MKKEDIELFKELSRRFLLLYEKDLALREKEIQLAISRSHAADQKYSGIMQLLKSSIDILTRKVQKNDVPSTKTESKVQRGRKVSTAGNADKKVRSSDWVSRKTSAKRI